MHEDGNRKEYHQFMKIQHDSPQAQLLHMYYDICSLLTFVVNVKRERAFNPMLVLVSGFTFFFFAFCTFYAGSRFSFTFTFIFIYNAIYRTN